MAPWKKWLFGINALVAAAGMTLSFTLAALGVYPSVNTNPTMLGNPEQGPIGRILDFFTYFTIWSNILVAVVLFMLFLKPDRDSFWFRALRLDSVLMIVVTGLVYNVVLAGTVTNQGFEVVTNFFDHILTPVVTLVVWLVCGPRGWISVKVIAASLVVPIVWLIWALIRGAFIGAYPYPFLDVATLGYGAVLVNVLGVVVLAIVISVILWGVDWVISRLTQQKQEPAAAS